MSFEAPPPDPANPDLLIGINNYLKAHGVIREPSEDKLQYQRGTLWIEPQFGVPAPGEKQGLGEEEFTPTLDEGGPGLSVGIEKLAGIPSGPYEGFIRSSHVQFVVRVSRPDIATEFEQKLRELLNDKRGWTMYDVPVNESLLYRDMQEIGKDNTGWTYTIEYSFLLWGPFTPVGP